MANEYATLAQLKARMVITDTDRDTILQSALDAAHGQVNEYCGRRFNLDAAVSARTYRTARRISVDPDGDTLLIDDVGTATGLLVETGVTTFVAVTGTVEPQPENAIARGRPITGLLLSNQSWPRDPSTRVRVTAKWGWPTVPAEVTEATLIRAAQIYKRKDSPEGVLGTSEWGAVRVSREDPDFKALLRDRALAGIA